MSKWIKLVGEVKHTCDLPWSLGGVGMSPTHLQQKHQGSIWECDCGERYIWDGKSFNITD